MATDDKPTDGGKRREALRFAIVDVDIWNNPKVCKAGPLATLAFVFALTRNASHGRTGSFPASEFEPWYLSRQIGLSEPEASQARQRCMDARLLAEGLSSDGDHVIDIVGWDAKYKRTDLTEYERERKRKYRAKRKPDPEKSEDQIQDPRDRSREREIESPGTCPGTNSPSPHLDKAIALLTNFNNAVKRKLKHTEAHLREPLARLEEGHSYDDLLAVLVYCLDAGGKGWSDPHNTDAAGKSFYKQQVHPHIIWSKTNVDRHLDDAIDEDTWEPEEWTLWSHPSWKRKPQQAPPNNESSQTTSATDTTLPDWLTEDP